MLYLFQQVKKMKIQYNHQMDFKKGEKLAYNDVMLYEDLLEMYLEQSDDLLEKMENSLKNHIWNEYFECLRIMNNSSQLIGNDSLESFISSQHLLFHFQRISRLKSQHKEFINQYEDVKTMIKEYIKKEK